MFTLLFFFLQLQMINGVGVKNGLGPGERGYDSFYGLYGSAHNHFTKEVCRFRNAPVIYYIGS